MKRDKIKARIEKKPDGSTIRIPPKAKYNRRKLDDEKLRIAAYCRVSTDSDDQYTSFESQKQHYLDYIGKHKNWELIRIYADEGISGTSTKRRDAFNQMIDDATEGMFDMIITKTVSRFTRNVVDGLVAARNLLHLDPPVGILFEEDKFNTLMPNCEFILTIMLSLAQGESAKKSESMITSYEWRYNRDDYFCPTTYLLGYETDDDGNMVVEPEGAKTVRAIYTMYLAGKSATEIARTLTNMERPTGKNNLIWSSGSVMNVIRNEKYCGDIFGQKSFVVDFLEHKRAKNEGQKWIHYMANHHEPIVTRDEHVRALLMSKANRSSQHFNPAYEMRVIHEGLLSGFIPINCAFGGYDAGHYLCASDSVAPAKRRRKAEIVYIEGCELMREQEFCAPTTPSVTVSAKSFTFNKECVSLLHEAEYAEILIHPAERLLAIRKVNAENKNAIPWRAGTVSSAIFMPVLYELCGWNNTWKYRAPAVCLTKNKELVLLFDFNETETLIYETETDANGTSKRSARSYMPPAWRDTFGASMSGVYSSCRQHLAVSLDKWLTNAPALPVSGFENTIELPDDSRIQIVLKAMEVTAV